VFFAVTELDPPLIIFISTTTWPTKVWNTELFSPLYELNYSVFQTFVGHVVVEIKIIKVGTSFVKKEKHHFWTTTASKVGIVSRNKR
jgi:hypothetical protein